MSLDILLKGILYLVIAWSSVLAVSDSFLSRRRVAGDNMEFSLSTYSFSTKIPLVSENSSAVTCNNNCDEVKIGPTPPPFLVTPVSHFFSQGFSKNSGALLEPTTVTSESPSTAIPTTSESSSTALPTTGLPYNLNDTWKWVNDIDYDSVTQRVLKRLNGKDPDCEPYYVVYSVDSTVGFANQFRSLCSIFLIALVSGRKLRIIWDDYFSVMNNSFASLQFTNSEVRGRAFKSYTRFPRGVCSDPKYSSHNVTRIFGNRDLFFNVLTDLSCLVLSNPHYRDVLRSLGFIVPEEEDTDTINYEKDRLIRTQIARMLFTPNAEITYVVRNNLMNFTKPHVLSVQLRTGGSVSITAETHRFLYISSLPLVYEEIEFVLQKMHWNKSDTILFVSTDSGIIMNNMIRHYQEQMLVLNGVGYRSGHSSSYLAPGRKHLQFLKRAILDLTLMAHSDYILYTHGSSYGKLAMRLSNSSARALCRDKHCTPLE